MKLKVVQCWDDGVATDIRLTDMLREYGAKATFNLNPGRAPAETLPIHWTRLGEELWSYKGFCPGKLATSDWRRVYRGFKVASHCWLHETTGCGGTVSEEEFVASALRARKFLEDMFEDECPGFAWPCGMSSPLAVKLMREIGFAYGRTVGQSDDVTDCAEPLLLNASCHFQDRWFLKKYEQAKSNGVFYFWGHSYEMLDCEGLWNQLEQKLRMISEDPEAEWCDVIDIVPLCRTKTK